MYVFVLIKKTLPNGPKYSCVNETTQVRSSNSREERTNISCVEVE